MTKQVEISQLKAFSPIDSLKKDNLGALVKKTKVRDAQPGEALFREGDAEKRTFYILSGTVELREGSQPASKITGGTDDARNPLSPKLPRRHTAIAVTARRVHHDRQRSARRHADVGPDRVLRGFGAAR